MATLARAVGRGAESPLKKDVMLVQQLLNRHRPPSLPAIDEDGAQGDETFEAIEEFQRRILKMKSHSLAVWMVTACLTGLEHPCH